jgi:hypothetical protein
VLPSPPSPVVTTTVARLGEFLINNQMFRNSILYNLHGMVPADVCARFLLCSLYFNDPLKHLVAALTSFHEVGPPRD